MLTLTLLVLAQYVSSPIVTKRDGTEDRAATEAWNAVRNPDGTRATQREFCALIDLGSWPRPLSPDVTFAQGFGFWNIYAKGEIALSMRSESGWWMGQWVDDGVWINEPRTVGASIRDEKWRHFGMPLDGWAASGRVMACARGGSAYLWGSQLKAWAEPYTAQPFAKICEAPLTDDCG